MPVPRRALVLALALSSIVACEDPFADGGPAVSPGVVVPGLTNVCIFTGCSAWSADGKTFYVLVNPGAATGAWLVAIDPATLAVDTVGRIDVTITGLTPTTDGTAIFFEAPDPARSSGEVIKKMTLASGSITTLVETRQLDFAVSPDGSALAYHTVTSHTPDTTLTTDTTVATSLTPDTVVVLDVPSGIRRATSIEVFPATIGAFSGDGTEVSIVSPLGALHVLHIAGGAVDVIRLRHLNSGVSGISWSGGAFHLLFASIVSATFTDTSLAGGAAVALTVDPNVDLFQWLPDRSAIWTGTGGQVCEPADCKAKRYDFAYITETKSVIVGAGLSRSLPLMNPSPDGRWLAHAETSGGLYLLRGPTP